LELKGFSGELHYCGYGNMDRELARSIHEHWHGFEGARLSAAPMRNKKKPGFSRWGEPLETSCGAEKGACLRPASGAEAPVFERAVAARLKAALFQSKLRE
jgi:hypothetical protein